MLKVRSFDRYDHMFDYDPINGVLTPCQADISSEPQIDGVVAQFEGETWMLYRHEGALHLIAPGYDVIVDDDTYAKLLKDSVNMLEVYHGKDVLLRKPYHRPHPSPTLEEDLTPFVEEEDFDFGVWLYNVINSHERRNRIYQVSAD